LADEFGFRGFNVTGENYVYSTGFGPPPGVSGFTDANGLATIPGTRPQLTPSAGPVGAVVIDSHLENVKSVPQLFFHEVRLANVPQGKPSVVVEFFNNAVGHYFITLLDDEIAKLDAGLFAGWTRSIGAFAAYAKGEDAPMGAVPVCRFMSTKFTSHFYTASQSECDHVAVALKDDWVLETRTAFYILEPDKFYGECPPNYQPIYRMFNDTSSPNHRYITDRKLRDRMIGAGWIAEGYGEQSVMMCTPA
jgi:hypothetical protein